MANMPTASAAITGSIRASHDQLHDLLLRPEAADARRYSPAVAATATEP